MHHAFPVHHALGALGGPISFYFPTFFPPLGAPYFSSYTAVISPPISPLKAAALFRCFPVQSCANMGPNGGAVPVNFHHSPSILQPFLVVFVAKKFADTVSLGQQPKQGEKGEISQQYVEGKIGGLQRGGKGEK